MESSVRGLRHRVRIASGAYGVVYRASSPTRVKTEDGTDKARTYYAIKRLLVSRNTSFCSCIRELDLVMSSQHPYVVQCQGLAPLDSIFEGGRPASRSKRYKDDDSVQVYTYYASTLDSVGKLPREELILLVLRLLVGLEYIHGRGIVHRDLKPSNVMIDDLGRPRIGDFGQAQRTCLVTSDIGQTLRYRSPELLARRPVNSYDPRASDVWALGCMIWELTHDGRSPFSVINNAGPEGITEASLLEDITDTLDSEEETGEDSLEDLAKSLLIVDPTCRPRISQLVNHAIFERHPLFDKIQRVRVACPPFSGGLENLTVNDTAPLRIEAGQHLRRLASCLPKITPREVCTFASLFHVLEIVDRLISTHTCPLQSTSSIVLICLYIMHKYLSEDHVREALSFDMYCNVLYTAGYVIEKKESDSWWGQLEAEVLRSLGFIVYRTTPYEYRLNMSGLPTSVEITRLLTAYSHLPSGNYHVGDVVAAAKHLSSN